MFIAIRIEIEYKHDDYNFTSITSLFETGIVVSLLIPNLPNIIIAIILTTMVAGKILAISRGLAHFIHHSNLCTTSGCHIKSIMPKISSRTLISPKESLCQEGTKAG